MTISQRIMAPMGSFTILALLFTITTAVAQEEPAAPKITLAPKNQKVGDDMLVSFFCKATGHPPPTFHWEKEGKKLNSKRNYRYFIHKMPHGSVLRIEPVKARKVGSDFTCVAENEYGRAEANVTLTIYPTSDIPPGFPMITQDPVLKSIEKDHTATLTCQASAVGLPNPPYMYWLKESIPVDLSDPRISILEGGSLVIEKSQESDMGKYECVAENEVGVSYSSAAMLYVKVRRVPPHFSIPPEDIEVDPGADVNITCVAVGSPMPLVKWREGAKDLMPEDELPVGRNILTLTKVRESKNYTCVASSDLGNIEHDVQVKVKALPNPPVKLRASEITAASLKLTWEPGGMGPVLSYSILYKPKHVTGDYTKIFNIRHTEYTIDQLQAYTQYEFRVLASNNLGDGVPSSPIEVVTGELVPLQPRNLQATAVSPNEIEITWDAPQDANKIIGYILYYNDSKQHLHGEITINPPSTKFKLTDLIPDNVYHIQLSARCATGEGVRTPTIQLKTPQFVTGEPKRVKVEAVNSTTIFVEWHPPQAQERNGIIRGYYVYYLEVDTNDDPIPSTEKKIDTEDGNKMDVVIVNLKPDTRYHVQVAGYTRRGDGIRSKSRTVTTKGAVPSAPRNLQAELIQAEPPQVQVSWHRPEEIHGNLEGYKLYWGRIGELYRQIILQANQQSYIATLLDCGATYEFGVLARNQVDYGERAVTTIDTPNGQPPTPENVKVQRTSPTTIQVTWDEPPPDSAIESYRVYYNNLIVADMSIWKTIDTDGPTTVTQITNFDVKTSCAIRVQAKSVNGCWSNFSQAVVTDFMPKERPEMVQNFQASEKSSRYLVLSWDAPRKKNVNNYLLMYMGTKSGFTQLSNAPLQEVKIPGQLEIHPVRNLVPKMKYEFNISAIFQDGTIGEETQLIVETRIEAPQKVEAPKIQKITGGKITLRLSAASEMFGPLSHYEVIVVHEENTTKLPKDFTQEELTKEQTPVTFRAMQPYIAAKFTPKGFPSEFTLGTGGQVGGYYNRPLDPDRMYRVFLRAYTVKITLYKSSDYSDLFQPRGKIDPMLSYPPNVLPPDTIQDPVPVTDGDKNLMIVIIVCASGGLIVIRVGCAIFIVYMRRKGPRMKKAPETTSKLIVDNVPPHPSDPVEMRRQHYQTPVRNKLTAYQPN